MVANPTPCTQGGNMTELELFAEELATTAVSDGAYLLPGWDVKRVRAALAQPASVPTEAQILSACEEAGLWPNTAASWVANGAFKRYHEAINRTLAAAPSAPQPAQAVPVAWIRWEWNRTGSKSLVFDRPAKLSLSEEARGVVYDPLYAAPSAQAEPYRCPAKRGEDPQVCGRVRCQLGRKCADEVQAEQGGK